MGAVDEKCLRCGRRCRVDRGIRDKLSGWCMECLNGPPTWLLQPLRFQPACRASMLTRQQVNGTLRYRRERMT